MERPTTSPANRSFVPPHERQGSRSKQAGDRARRKPGVFIITGGNAASFRKVLSSRRFPLDEEQARNKIGAHGLHEENRAEGETAALTDPHADVMPVHGVYPELLPE
jgi:hypothetical protein